MFRTQKVDLKKMNKEDVFKEYIQINPPQYSSKEVSDALKRVLERYTQFYGKEKKMDDKEILKDCAEKDELLKTVGALNSILPQYMDDCIDDYKEQSTIKTDWLNKKMR